VSGRLLDYAAPVLRAARIGAHLSQAEIAKRAGVSDATISRMETGKAWPSGRNVESVIDAYATATGFSQLDFLERIVVAWREDERGGA
jgi:transcriptional regulator with XRE-family HTH domain